MPLIDHTHLQGAIQPVPICRGRLDHPGINPIAERAREAARQAVELPLFPSHLNHSRRASRARHLAAAILTERTCWSKTQIAAAIGVKDLSSVDWALRVVQPSDPDFIAALARVSAA